MTNSTLTVNPFSEILIGFSSERFYGRKAIIGKIMKAISSRNNFYLFSIKGNFRIGKTSLLKYLCSDNTTNEFSEYLMDYKSNQIKFVYINLERLDDKPSNLYFLYDKMFIALHIDPNEKDPSPDAIHNLFKQYQANNTRLVVCLDDFDNFFKSLTIEEEKLIRHYCSHQCIITATQKSFLDLRLGAKRSPLVSIMQPLVLSFLEESEAKELISKPIADSKQSFTDSEVQFLIELAGLHPYLLILSCAAVFDLRIEQNGRNLDKLLSDEPWNKFLRSKIGSSPGIEELFAIFWKNLDSDDRKCLIKIARGEQPDLSNEAPALNSLRNNSLIRDDLAKRKWFIFSHLFQDYIIRQSGSAASEDIEYILEDLAPLERNLFLYLSERPNRICGTEELKRIFWDGLDSNKQKRGLEAAIHRIRSSARYKSSGWNYLRNERGIGFIFVPKSE